MELWGFRHGETGRTRLNESQTSSFRALVLVDLVNLVMRCGIGVFKPMHAMLPVDHADLDFWAGYVGEHADSLLLSAKLNCSHVVGL